MMKKDEEFDFGLKRGEMDRQQGGSCGRFALGLYKSCGGRESAIVYLDLCKFDWSYQ